MCGGPSHPAARSPVSHEATAGQRQEQTGGLAWGDADLSYAGALSETPTVPASPLRPERASGESERGERARKGRGLWVVVTEGPACSGGRSVLEALVSPGL